MKTMKTIFMITAVAFAAIATAIEKPKMNVVPLDSEKAVVALSNENPAFFEISVSSDDGNTIYYKMSDDKLTDYNKVYDFSQLNNGIYQISLKVSDTKVKRKFQIYEGKIFVGKAKVTYDPYFSFNNEEFKMSFLNFDREKLTLYLFQDGQLVYRSKLGDDFVIHSGYNLSKLSPGNYNVVLNSKNESFAYSFEK